MRRKCTENESMVLKDNIKLLCSGKIKESQGRKTSDALISLFVWMILMFASILLQINMPRIVFYISQIMLLNITVITLTSIFRINRIRKSKRKFIRGRNLEINEAYVIGVSTKLKFIRYIEDGRRDKSGNPYILQYPACSADFKGISAGDRMLVIYEDNDENSSFNLMKASDDIKKIMSSEKADFSSKDIGKFNTYPHPSCARINRYTRNISKEEKEKILAYNSRSIKKSTKKEMLILSAVITVSLNLIIYLLVSFSEISIVIAPVYSVLSLLATWLYYSLGMKLKENTQKKFECFNKVTEVVFIKTIASIRGNTGVYVYEWRNNSFKEVQYPRAVIQYAEMGDVLYKVETAGYTFFYQKE